MDNIDMFNDKYVKSGNLQQNIIKNYTGGG